MQHRSAPGVTTISQKEKTKGQDFFRAVSSAPTPRAVPPPTCLHTNRGIRKRRRPRKRPAWKQETERCKGWGASGFMLEAEDGGGCRGAARRPGQFGGPAGLYNCTIQRRPTCNFYWICGGIFKSSRKNLIFLEALLSLLSNCSFLVFCGFFSFFGGVRKRQECNF